MVDDSDEPDERPSQPPGCSEGGKSGLGAGDDTLFRLLGHVCRREVCWALSDRSEWSLTELAERLAAREAGMPESDVTAETVTNVRVALYHTHLPKLQEHRVVRFDRDAERITPAVNTEPAVAVLEEVAAARQQWEWH